MTDHVTYVIVGQISFRNKGLGALLYIYIYIFVLTKNIWPFLV